MSSTASGNANGSMFTIPRKNIYYRAWTWALGILAVVSVIISHIYMVFCDKSYALSVLDVILNVIFLMDLVLTFLVAYEDNVTHSQIAWNYFARNYLVVDFFASLPVQVFQGLLNKGIIPLVIIYGIFTVLRVWRLKKFLAWISEIGQNPRCFFWSQIVKLVSLVLLNIHVWGCIFYLIASVDPDSKMSWTSGRKDFFKQKFWTRYVTSLYFAMTTYSTVGYGDFHAWNNTEMIFSIIYMTWNFGFGACLLQYFINLVIKETMHTDTAASEGAAGNSNIPR